MANLLSRLVRRAAACGSRHQGRARARHRHHLLRRGPGLVDAPATSGRSPAKASSATPSSTAPCAWWRRPPPPCPWGLVGDTDAAPHPLEALLARPNPREGGARLLESLYWTPHGLGERLPPVPRPRRGAPRTPCAAPRPHAGGARPRRLARRLRLHGRRAHPALRPDGGGRAPDPPPHPVPPHRRLLRPLADGRRRRWRWTSTTRPAPGTRRCSNNAARPSGALVFATQAGSTLSEAQFTRLKGELEANYQGAGNAGRPLLLEGGLDWKPLALSPKDMDFVEAKSGGAPRDRAGLRRARPCCSACPATTPTPTTPRPTAPFYRQTVIPLVRRTAEALGPLAGTRLRPRPPGTRPRRHRGARPRAREPLAPGCRRRTF